MEIKLLGLNNVNTFIVLIYNPSHDTKENKENIKQRISIDIILNFLVNYG